MRTNDATHTFSGGIDPTAVIGHAPERFDWRPADGAWEPDLGERVRIEAFVAIDAGMEGPTKIGDRTWIKKHVHVGHDAIIGADCDIGSGTIISPFCVVGDCVTIGAGSYLGPDVVVDPGAEIPPRAILS